MSEPVGDSERPAQPERGFFEVKGGPNVTVTRNIAELLARQEWIGRSNGWKSRLFDVGDPTFLDVEEYCRSPSEPPRAGSQSQEMASQLCAQAELCLLYTSDAADVQL